MGVWGVVVGEGLLGRDVPTPYGVETAGGGVIGVGGFIFDGVAVLELPAGVASKVSGFAVEDAGEVRGVVAVEVVADGFGVEGEGGGIIGEDTGGDAVGDGLLATEFVGGDGDVGRAVAVVGGGEFSGAVVAVGGGDSSGPGAGVEAATGGVGVVSAFAVGAIPCVRVGCGRCRSRWFRRSWRCFRPERGRGWSYGRCGVCGAGLRRCRALRRGWSGCRSWLFPGRWASSSWMRWIRQGGWLRCGDPWSHR